MKNVIHIITTIERGGAENQLRFLAEEQTRLGMNVTVIALKGEPELYEAFTRTGVYVDLSLLNKPFLTQLVILRKLKMPDCIFHAHLPRSELLSAFAGLDNLVFTRHNAEPFFPKYPGIFSKILSRYVAMRAKSGIAISNAVRSFLVESGEISPKFNLHTVLYGFPEHQGCSFAKDIELQKELTILESDILIGTVARLTNQKDIETLLRAFSLSLRSNSKLRLIVVGDGPDRKELASVADNLKISSRVIWAGRRSDIPELMCLMDVFVLSSLYEGLGLVLLEAMTANLPIVASNNSAIPEVLGSDHAGLAKTSDALDFSVKIEKMLISEVREVVLSHQKERLKFFTSGQMITKVTSVYREVETSISKI